MKFEVTSYVIEEGHEYERAKYGQKTRLPKKSKAIPVIDAGEVLILKKACQVKPEEANVDVDEGMPDDARQVDDGCKSRMTIRSQFEDLTRRRSPEVIRCQTTSQGQPRRTPSQS